MYAYDTSIFHQSHEITQLNEAITRDVYQLEKWWEGNKLSLNVVETSAMLISTKQKHKILKDHNKDLLVKIRGTEIEVFLNAKYLGIHVDNSQEWKEHIKVMSSKVSRAVGFLKHARSFLSLGALKTLHNRIVEPHFRYGCSLCTVVGLQSLARYKNCKTS